MLATIKTYDSFNQRRYSDPWVAPVKSDGKIDFSGRCGGYTGGYHTGNAGDLYVAEPVEGQVYAYGQKDYRGGNTEIEYARFAEGAFVAIDRLNLVAELNKQN